MGPKIFTVREANVLIPEIESVFSDLDKVRARLKKVKNKIDVLEMLWGEEIHSEENPDSREHAHYQEQVEQAKRDFDAATLRLSEMEVVLKGLENGLIDFYGVIQSRLVFLCWKRGEEAVSYYHQLEDGYVGRQLIPAEELAS